MIKRIKNKFCIFADCRMKDCPVNQYNMDNQKLKHLGIFVYVKNYKNTDVCVLNKK